MRIRRGVPFDEFVHVADERRGSLIDVFVDFDEFTVAQINPYRQVARREPPVDTHLCLYRTALIDRQRQFYVGDTVGLAAP